jgi:hypothetical protein
MVAWLAAKSHRLNMGLSFFISLEKFNALRLIGKVGVSALLHYQHELV